MRLQFIAAMAALTAAPSANAFHFSPANATVNMAGKFTVRVDGALEMCEIKATVKTNQTGTSAKMTSFTPSGDCGSVTAVGLPWKVNPDTLSQATIKEFGYTEPDVTCGPIQLRVTVNGSGLWYFVRKIKGTLGACEIGGPWTSTPVLTITQ